MITLTRGLGLALIIVGIAGYLGTDRSSVTALIPALLGVIIGGLGIAAGRPTLHRTAIHGALVFALLGVLGTLMNVVELPALLSGDGVERPGAVIASTVTLLLCAAYLVAGMRSFAAARRARTPSTSSPAEG